MAWATASTLIKVVFVLVIIAVILDLIGFATPYWIAYEGHFYAYDRRLYYGYINSGLWRLCEEVRGGSTFCAGRPSGASKCLTFVMSLNGARHGKRYIRTVDVNS
jgi:hypothetical protein